MTRFPAGSDWRKWDLHVHVPGTKCSDGYVKANGAPDWDRFAHIIENSDVAVIGVTDYFSADQSLDFIAYFKAKYPNSQKLLLVNIELRLNVTVNGAGEIVHFHVLFRDSVSRAKIDEFLARLKTQTTDSNGRQKTCAELSNVAEFNSSSVHIGDVQAAFTETFGSRAEPSDYLIYLAPANNDGLRAASGSQRKAILADEIDKIVHAIFGKNTANSAYFLKTDRYEDPTQESKPKPVFGGCDAHNFTDLEQWLGRAVTSEHARQVITWIKADPTFEGLQQTLVEPADRVSLSELMPDAKDPYKVIKRVTFQGSQDFPDEIVLNPNLNAIIGSRSSGKSALLAHIAHAVDPDYTIKQQTQATKVPASEVGPAAGHTWKSVASTVCQVEWADGSQGGGNVIYIPQNWLFQISGNPREVTGKINPVLEAHYPTYFREHNRQLDSVRAANDAIRKAVNLWFDVAGELQQLEDESKQLGDRQAITRNRDDIKAQIEKLRAENALSADDLARYQEVVAEIDHKRERIAEIGIEAEQLDGYVVRRSRKTFTSASGTVTAEINLVPSPQDVPEKLAETLTNLVAEAESSLVGKAEGAIVAFRSAIASESHELEKQIKKLEADNVDLIRKHKANAALDELVNRQKTQQASLDKIDKLTGRHRSLVNERDAAARQIGERIEARAAALAAIVNAFHAEPRTLGQLSFEIEIDFDSETIELVSDPFNKHETGTLLRTGPGWSDRIVDIAKAQSDPAASLRDILTGRQKLNRGHIPADVATRVLAATREIRFSAELDGDRIGGFEPSTMTPGKQALFALTLILGEAEEGWTLLVDQPEDDLDSRSIFHDIVTYLVAQKKQRQIIMVTHNANLVVGADAEEVLVANRHGDDRKNRGDRTFDYLTGSLEQTQHKRSATYDLDRMGIREHAVDILDGGEEAFQKRRDKYKL